MGNAPVLHVSGFSPDDNGAPFVFYLNDETVKAIQSGQGYRHSDTRGLKRRVVDITWSVHGLRVSIQEFKLP